MADQETLKQRLVQLKKRWNILHTKQSEVQKQYDTETHADVRFRARNILTDLNTELSTLETELVETGQRLKQGTLDEKLSLLRTELARLRRNKAYQEALDVARQIQVIAPNNGQIKKDITELQERLEQSLKAQQIFARLTVHFSSLAPVITELAEVLGVNSNHEHTRTISIVAERFLDGSLATEEFIEFCQNLLRQPHESSDKSPDYVEKQYIKIAESIRRGRTVLFLGSEVPSLYQQQNQHSDENQLVKLLAEEVDYQDFSGSLSSIAEYYQLAPGFGRNSLLSNLQKSLPQNLANLSFYQSLSRIETSLVVISAAYDTLLEDTFSTAGKPYVEIASIIIPGEGHYKLGNVIMRFSDTGKETVCSKETLSELELLKNYSIIYKLRGSCGSYHINGDTGWRNSLTLSESNYFTFAESAGRIIPDYITRQFLDREFLFLGFTPANWEDRLLARTILLKRQNHPEPCYTIGKTNDPLQSIFWKKQKVHQYEMDFNELDHQLQEATL